MGGSALPSAPGTLAPADGGVALLPGANGGGDAPPGTSGRGVAGEDLPFLSAHSAAPPAPLPGPAPNTAAADLAGLDDTPDGAVASGLGASGRVERLDPDIKAVLCGIQANDHRERVWPWRSLFFISLNNPARKLAIRLSESKWFRHGTLMLILLNTVALSMGSNAPGFRNSSLGDALRYAEIFFTLSFTVEMAIKVLAMGLLLAPGSYMRDPWNLLDMAVVILGLVGLPCEITKCAGGGNYTSIRVVRVFRPLRAINGVKGMRVLVSTIIQSLPMLVDVLLLCSFVFVLMGIIGVTMFQGVLRSRCSLPQLSQFASGAAEGSAGSLVDDLTPELSAAAYQVALQDLGGAGVPVSFDQLEFVLPEQLASDDEDWSSTTCSGWSSDKASYVVQTNAVTGDLEIVAAAPGVDGDNFSSGAGYGCPWPSSQGPTSEAPTQFPSLVLGPLFDPTMMAEGDAAQVGRPGLVCSRSFENPSFLRVGFDNIALAWLTIFQCITLEGWTEIVYRVEDATSGWAWLYFVALLLLGSFFMVNLFLAVLYLYFTMSDAEETDAEEKEEEVEKAKKQLELLEVQTELAKGELVAGGGGAGRLTGHLRDVLFDEVFQQAVAAQSAGEPGKRKPPPRAALAPDAWWGPFNAVLPVWLGLRRVCWKLYFDKWFDYLTSSLIVFNTAVMASEYYGMSKAHEEAGNVINYLLTAYFGLEMLIKHVGIGARRYWKDSMNAFDGIVVVASVSEIILTVATPDLDSSTLSVLRAFRILRLFKLVKSWKELQKLLRTMKESLSSIGYLSLIGAIVVVIYALLGMQVFGYKFNFCGDRVDGAVPYCPDGFDCPTKWDCYAPCNPADVGLWVTAPGSPYQDVAYCEALSSTDEVTGVTTSGFWAQVGPHATPRSNFDSFGWSVLAIFQIVTGEDWNTIMTDGMRVSLVFSVFYFLSFMLIGFYVILNLFLAILLDNFAGYATSPEDEAKAKEEFLAREEARRAVAEMDEAGWMGEGSGDNAGGPDVGARMLDQAKTLGRSMAVPRSREGSLGGEPDDGGGLSRRGGGRFRMSSLARSRAASVIASRVNSRTGSMSGGSRPVSTSGTPRVSNTGHTSPGGVGASRLSMQPVPSAVLNLAEVGGGGDSGGAASSVTRETGGLGAGGGEAGPVGEADEGRGSPDTGDNDPAAADAADEAHLGGPRRGPSPHDDRAAARKTSGSRVVVPGVSQLRDVEPHGRPAGTKKGAGLLDEGHADHRAVTMVESDRTVGTEPASSGRQHPGEGGSDSAVHSRAADFGGQDDQDDNVDELADLGPTMAERDREDVKVALGYSSCFVWSGEPNLGRFRSFCAELILNKWFEGSVMVLIALSSIALALDEPGLDPDGTLKRALKVLDLVFVVAFLLEAMAKVVALGFVMHPKAYLRSAFNFLDFFIVAVSTFLVILDWTPGLSAAGGGLSALRALRTARALRPMRMAVRYKGLRVVVGALFGSIPAMGNVVMVCLLFFLVFGIAGVNFFSGVYSRCVNVDSGENLECFAFAAKDAPQSCFTQDQCETGVVTPVASWYHASIGVQYPPAAADLAPGASVPALSANLATGSPAWSVPTRWERYIVNFDNVALAILVLFEVATLELWLVHMDNALDSRALVKAGGPGDPQCGVIQGCPQQPIRDSRPFYAIYFVLFVLVGSFFVLNLFVGVIIDKFNEMKEKNEGKSIFLTDRQVQWLAMRRMALVTGPVRRPSRPRGRLRSNCYSLIFHPAFDPVVMMLIIANVVVMCLESWQESKTMENALFAANIAFTTVYGLEAIAKLAALGSKNYFSDNWNAFDFIIVLVSVAGIVVETQSESAQAAQIIPLLRVARIGRVFRLIPKAKGLRTLFSTLILSLPALWNVGGMLLLFFFMFAVMGMQLFGSVVYGEFLNRHANFTTFLRSMGTLFRMATGEAWNGIMHDAMTNDGCALLVQDFTDNTTSPPTTWLAGSWLNGPSGREPNVSTYGLVQWVPGMEDPKEGQWEDHCSPGAAICVIYFLVFMILVSFIMFNLVVAIILDNYQSTSEDESLAVNKSHMDQFRAVWAQHDPAGSARIEAARLPGLIAELQPPLGVRGLYVSPAYVQQLIMSCDIPNRDGYVTFHELLYALSQRAAIARYPELGQELVSLGASQPDDERRFWRTLNRHVGHDPNRPPLYSVGHYHAALYVQAAVRGFLARYEIRRRLAGALGVDDSRMAGLHAPGGGGAEKANQAMTKNIAPDARGA